jgi:quinol monooxygenase YgiN
MIIVTGSVTAREGAEVELRRLSTEHSARSREEPGCLRHDALTDPADPRHILFLEEWVDADALQAHFRVPSSVDFVRRARQLTDGEAEIHMYEARPWCLPGGDALTDVG